MASAPENVSMALFCDFENVALGVRDAQYEKFDIKPVLERLLVKGSIVVKKAYCDWDRYKAFKAGMHEANFELIEIPHVRQSGKNSADIRLVVDALDLCYTKAHVDTFVIISGDSDFSPLVSKLRENAKQVIGVGVKQSTSDLLIANCDEFIFYDDLVRDREAKRATVRKDVAREAGSKRGEDDRKRKEELRSKGIELAVATFEDLMAERSDTEKLWASVLKEAIKRRNPGFNESYYGFKAFGNLLEEAQHRGLIAFGRDEKSGAYVFRSASTPLPASPVETSAPAATTETPATAVAAQSATPEAAPRPATEKERNNRGARGKGRNRKGEDSSAAPEPAAPVAQEAAPTQEAAPAAEPPAPEAQPQEAQAQPVKSTARKTSPRKPPARKSGAAKASGTKESGSQDVATTDVATKGSATKASATKDAGPQDAAPQATATRNGTAKTGKARKPAAAASSTAAAPQTTAEPAPATAPTTSAAKAPRKSSRSKKAAAKTEG
ncbi:NYN domain-containing protein [Azovibrio restrictus]|uniref:NYN domain-containing protein n=1 Tax=Azovibrio restrictus TaxID=146938 RepID=UPI0026EE3247|nr:NYN domain-containing protein [Azovibrio restrictus]MDD3484728.1 NYN domain-containing protein [Azovibrio restrictus]